METGTGPCVFADAIGPEPVNYMKRPRRKKILLNRATANRLIRYAVRIPLPEDFMLRRMIEWFMSQSDLVQHSVLIARPSQDLTIELNALLLRHMASAQTLH